MSDPVEHDLELTVSALKDGPTDLGIAGGRLELGRWTGRLAGSDDAALAQLGSDLSELDSQLASGSPDAATVTDLLRRIGGATLEAAQSQPEGDVKARLRELGNLLSEGAAEIG